MHTRSLRHLGVVLTLVCMTLAVAASRLCAQATWVEQIDALRRKVRIAQDTDATRKLAELRAAQRRERTAAIESLRKGLQAYLRKDFLTAGVELRRATRAPDVVQLADCFLLKNVRTMIEECPEKTPEVNGAGVKRCPNCGNTGHADCKICHGAGSIRCTKCGGRGYIRVRPKAGVRLPAGRKYLRQACPKCAGTGVRPCEKCLGSGVVACQTCTKKAGAEPDELGPNALEAVKKVICITRYLRQGGVDLYSTEALKPSSAALKKP